MTATANTNISLGNDSAEILAGSSVGYISGSGGNDTITSAINGVAPGSTLEGGLGDDSIYSRGVGDIALGGLGNDIIRNDSGRASLVGGAGNDIIFGEDRQTTVYGGAGNDSILFTDRENLAYGDAGNDTIVGLSGGDIFAGGAGNDYLDAAINGGNNASILFGNEGNDTLVLGDTSADSGFGGKDSDYVFAGSSATAKGQFLGGDKGADKIEYLGAGDSVILDGDRNASLDSAGTDAGADSFILGSGGATKLTITGGAGNDSIEGTLGAGAQVFMGKGDDYFNITSSGSSSFSGDLGNDSGSISLAGNDTLFGDGAAQGSDVALGNDTFTITGSGGNIIFGDTATGTDGGNDKIDVTGAGSSNVVYGGGGNDSLTSAGGNTLIGGAGNDFYQFGPGDRIQFDSLGVNTYVAGSGASTSDVVTVQPGDSFTGGATFLVTGEAELIKSLTNGGVIASDERDLIEITNVDGVTSLKGGDDTFSGVDLATTGVVSGGDGNDDITFTGTSIAAGLIDGGSGDDIVSFENPAATVSANVAGGVGDDTLEVAGIFAGSFSGGAGDDSLSIGTLGAGASIDMGAGDELVAITNIGTTEGVATILGGEGNDTISVGSSATGTSTDLVLDGGAGNDIIYGKASGGDSISGGDGDDTLFGGGFGAKSSTGTSISESLGDTLTGGAGADVFILGTTAKVGFLGSIGADQGSTYFGQDGWFFSGTNPASPGSGVFNGVFDVDVITDFNPEEGDVIIFNTTSAFSSTNAATFLTGTVGYLSDDLVTTGDYFGSTAGTTTRGADNGFGIVGSIGNSPIGSTTSTFGTGYTNETATTTVGSSTVTVRVLQSDLAVGGTAFGSDSPSNTGTITVTGQRLDILQFSAGGTAAGEIGTTGLFYDSGNGALYFDGKLTAIFADVPTLTSANFVLDTNYKFESFGNSTTVNPLDITI